MMHIRNNIRLIEFRPLNYVWMSMLGHVGEIVYAYGNKVVIVLMN